MKKSFLLSLAVGVIVVMVVACDKAAVHVGTDELVGATDDDGTVSDESMPEEDVIVDVESPVDVEAVVLPDEDLLPEQSTCGPISDPEPVETDHIVRLTRQWGGEASSGNESGFAVAFDSLGNMYIAGRTTSSFDCHQNQGETDIILLKMAMDGTVLWSRQWGTIEYDWPLGVAVDTDGHIFVAGVTGGDSLESIDIVVTKWRGDGTKMWEKLWGTDSIDFVHAVTLDNEGNLIMTGRSDNSLLLAKWDNDGNEIWTVLWDGSVSKSSFAVAVAPNGDILVAGATYGDLDGNTNAGGQDIFLSRFAADGVRLSTVQWGLPDSDDIAEELFVTQDGDIFVAGTTEGAFDGTTNAGGDCGDYCADAFLSRLDAAGNVIWTRQWGLPGDDHFDGLGSDGVGMVAAGGAMLRKYDLDGGEVWTGDIDTSFTRDLAVSADGTIAVTGYIIPGAGNYDVFAGVWDSSGVAEWSKTFNGNSSAEQGRALAVAANGAVFMAGTTDGALTGNQSVGGVDTFLAKSNGDGLLHWIEQAGTPERDDASSVVIDTDGSVYMTGHTLGSLDGAVSAGGADIYLVKRKNDGEKEWTRQWGTTGEDIGYAVAVDGKGNIYVAGSIGGVLSGNEGIVLRDVFLTKLTGDGTEEWTVQWGSAENDAAYAVAVDAAGNIFVTGETLGGIDGNTNKGDGCQKTIEVRHGGTVSEGIPCMDGFITKFTSAGVKVWTSQWGTAYIDTGRAITIGTDGFVYVAGSSGDYTSDGYSRGVRQALLAKWTTDGENVWTELWGSEAWSDARSLAVNANGDIFVTGHTIGSLDGVLSAVGGSDVFLVKMDDSGTRLWAEQWGSGLNDYGNAVAVGPDGRIFVAGYTANAFDGNLNRGGTDAFLSIVEEK